MNIAFDRPVLLVALVLALLLLTVLFLLHRKAAAFERNAKEHAEQNERNQQAILRLLDEMGSLADGDLTIPLDHEVESLNVAVAAGAAGAYATARQDVSAALPGVAVAVALVPPLAATGILIDADQMVLISTFRLPVQIHTRSANAKWLDEIAHTNPAWTHPTDAARLGVDTGGRSLEGRGGGGPGDGGAARGGRRTDHSGNDVRRVGGTECQHGP